MSPRKKKSAKPEAKPVEAPQPPPRPVPPHTPGTATLDPDEHLNPRPHIEDTPWPSELPVSPSVAAKPAPPPEPELVAESRERRFEGNASEGLPLEYRERLEALATPKLSGLSEKDADFCRRAVGEYAERTRKVGEKARELGYRIQAAQLQGDALYAEHVLLALFRPQGELPFDRVTESRAGLANMFHERLREADKNRLGTLCDELAGAVVLYARALWSAGYSAGSAARIDGSAEALFYSLNHVRHALRLAGDSEPAPPPLDA